MIRVFVLLLFLIPLRSLSLEAQVTTGAASSRSDEARRSLGQLCVPYSRESLAKQAGEGDLLAVKLFLEAGMKPDAYDHEGKTALMRAAYAGQREVAELLIAAGANVNLRVQGGFGSALFDAVFQRSFALAELLVSRGADVNLADGLSSTPLMFALQPGNERILQFLVDNNANLNSRNEGGKTALSQAAQLGSAEAVRILIRGKADVNVRDAQGQTPLMLVFSARVERLHIEVAKLLLAAKADPNIQDNQGQTALMLAAGRRNVEAVRLLLESKADVGLKDKHGRSVLKYLPLDSEIFRLLQNAGARE